MDENNCKNGEYISYKREEKRTNLKELPRPHKLVQSPLTERVQGRVQVGKTRLPPVGLSSLTKVMEERKPPQRYRLPSIGKKICP